MREIWTFGFEATAVSVPGSDSDLQFSGLIIFVCLMVATLALLPLAAAGLRRGLPTGQRATRLLDPVCFGSSQKSRRSPRHSILLHRGLVGAFFMALVALFLIPAAASLTALGVATIPAAIGFVLPTLLVTLHARRRTTNE